MGERGYFDLVFNFVLFQMVHKTAQTFSAKQTKGE